MRVCLFLIASTLAAQTLPLAVPMPNPEIQYLDLTGLPISGGKLCSYAAGTSTPLATYTDSTASTPNANPIILDTAGRASVWVGPKLYKFVLRQGGDGTCSTGAILYTQDNVADTTSYFVNFVKTAGSATIISFLNPATGAVQTTAAAKLAETLSVKDFGAAGDGTTNDTAAEQVGITWACSTAGASLFWPSGVYKQNALLTCNNQPEGTTVQGISLYGTGPNSILLNAGGTNGTLVIQSGGTATQHTDTHVHDLGFRNATTGASPYGLKLFAQAGGHIHDLVFQGTTAGGGSLAESIQLVATQGLQIDSIEMRGSIVGMHLLSATIAGNLTGNAVLTITSGEVGVTGSAFLIEGSDRVKISGFHIIGGGVGFDIRTAADLNNLIIENNHIEAVATAGILTASRTTGGLIVIKNNSFYIGFSPTPLAMDINSQYTVISGNDVVGPSTFRAAATNLTVMNNQFYVNPTNLATVRFVQYNNFGSGGLPVFTTPTNWNSAMTMMSADTAPGDILTLKANPGVAGNWGMDIIGGGSGTVFIGLGGSTTGTNPIIAGDNGSGTLQACAGSDRGCATPWWKTTATDFHSNSSFSVNDGVSILNGTNSLVQWNRDRSGTITDPSKDAFVFIANNTANHLTMGAYNGATGVSRGTALDVFRTNVRVGGGFMSGISPFGVNSVPVFASDAAAGAGGLLAGEMYRHSDGSAYLKQ